MPELPDVEIFKQYLDATALHQTIDRVEVDRTRILDQISEAALARALKGSKLSSTRRHGKHLLAALNRGQYLTLHFGMTGFLKYFRDPDHRVSHVRLRLSFTNGYNLAYVSQRMLGKVGLTEEPEQFIREKGLGPDALKLDLAGFKKILAGKRGMIKSTLMNQSYLAGLGNVYSDEILFRCALFPKIRTDSLDEEMQEKLYHEMVQTLKEAIYYRADPQKFPKSWLTKERQNGGDCPKGHGQLERIKVAGRTAYYCPRCQPRPEA
jgi:formamidopyrimidine-DNA glycosylase